MVQWVKGPGLATAAAWVRSLAEELPYIVSEAKKKKKKKKKILVLTMKREGVCAKVTMYNCVVMHLYKIIYVMCLVVGFLSGKEHQVCGRLIEMNFDK